MNPLTFCVPAAMVPFVFDGTPVRVLCGRADWGMEEMHGPLVVVDRLESLGNGYVVTYDGPGVPLQVKHMDRLFLDCRLPDVRDRLTRALESYGGTGESPRSHSIRSLARMEWEHVLTPDQYAEVFAWSVRSVMRGGKSIVEVAGPWKPSAWMWDERVGRMASVDAHVRVALTGLTDGVIVSVADADTPDYAGRWNAYGGWGLALESGPETGAEGRAAADRRILATGRLALLDEDGALTFPAGEP